MIPKQLPIVKIDQKYAKLGIDADLGTQSIKQPRPTMEMHVERPKQTIEQPRGQLTIDQSKAWDAMARGGNLLVMHRIYSQAREIAMQGIAKIVENGNRLAAIHEGGNPLADIASQTRVSFSEYQIAGPASFLNVQIRFDRQPPIIRAEDGKVHMNTRINPVQHSYKRGKLVFSMLQYPSVTFTPPDPQVDVRI